MECIKNNFGRQRACECGQCKNAESSESALNNLLCVNDVNYLISRLEQIKEHINDGNYHMASAKLLADISALSNIADT